MIKIIVLHLILTPIFYYAFVKGRIEINKQVLKNLMPYFIVGIGILFLQFFNVFVIDPLIKMDFTSVFSYEIPFWNWFSAHLSMLWLKPLLYFFIFVYLGIHSFVVYFTLALFTITEPELFKRLMKGFSILYLISFPFLIFFPITNVYTTFNLPSALEIVLPGIEKSYYSFTTVNNCFPSLHVAIPFLYFLYSKMSSNEKYRKFLSIYFVLVTFSVIFLAIHWITDMIGGLIFGYIAYKIENKNILASFKRFRKYLKHFFQLCYNPLQ